MKKLIQKIIIVLLFGFAGSFAFELKATHIVGGQLTYKCLGNYYYEITLIIRRDCKYGDPEVDFDKEAELGVYKRTTRAIDDRIGKLGVLEMPMISKDTLRESLNRICAQGGSEVCVQEAVYRMVVRLPLSEDGYILAYQRCCRNMTLTNIEEPLETGTTYAVTILPEDLVFCNSSPVFKSFPPIYVCQDRQFNFDHSATDIDGDSLVYSLCLPNIGLTKPDPKGVPGTPTKDSVILKSQYSINNLTNPNGTGTPIRIDSKTGLITGIPNTQGQYLIGVCVQEYRNGRLRSTILRDFELNVVPCGDKPLADFDRLTGLCNGFDQIFINKSKDANSYQWYFDYLGNLNASSTAINPSYSYSKEGTYRVVLIAINGMCVDTIVKDIRIINPNLKAAFDKSVTCDKELKINAKDRSTSNYTISSHEWTITGPMFNQQKLDKDPEFIVPKPGSYNLRLIITDINGCKDTTEMIVDIKTIEVKLIDDKSICSGDSTRLVSNPNASYTYNWSPTTGLNLNPPSNPWAKPSVTTTYKVTITDGNCTVQDEVTVQVRNSITFIVMGDTISCDGKFTLMASSDSTSIFNWSFDPNFTPPIFTGTKYEFMDLNNRPIYVKAGTSEQCSDIKKINLFYRGIDVSYLREISQCENDTSLNYKVTNNRASDTLDIIWKPSDLIISGQGTFTPKFKLNIPGTTIVYFMIRNQYGCMLSDSVVIKINPIIKPDINVEVECGSKKVKVSTSYPGKVRWTFGDGIGSSMNNRDEYNYSHSGKYVITLSADTLCAMMNSKEIYISLNDLELQNMVTVCAEEDIELNPKPELKYKYQWSPDTCFVDPTVPNPKLKTRKSGKFYVAYTDTANPICTFYDTIMVTLVPELWVTSAFKDTNICNPGIVKVTATSNAGEIIWCDLKGHQLGKGDTLSIDIKSDTALIAKGITGPCSKNDTIQISLIQFSSKIEGPEELCKGDTFMLSLIPADIKGWIYSWSPLNGIIGPSNNSKVTAVANQSGTYTITVRDTISGCEWTESHAIDVSDLGVIVVTATPSPIPIGAKTQLEATYNANYKYLWAPDDGSLSSINIYNPIAMPMVTTTYTVTVTDDRGCTATAVVTVVVVPCDENAFIPNAFSPNEDRINDTLFVRGNGLVTMEFVIYNRWGEEVFATNNVGVGWDGSHKGEKLPPDVYAYYVRYTCPDNKEYIKKGNVSLLK